MDNNKNKKEAEATVRKSEDGCYLDLTKVALTKKGLEHLNNEQMNELFAKLRLRFTLTPKCNLWCIFCSNEGSDYSSKKEGFADIDLVIKLSDMLIQNTSLKSIDFSGGEPLLHPDFNNEFKLIEWTKKHPEIRFSIHSNGLLLDKNIVDRISDNFSRIGISVHSLKFETWNNMTNLNCFFSEEVQKSKFNKMVKNIEYIGKLGIGHKVFIKSVVMKGVNDSEKELKMILELCDKYNFHPKFLEFEPQFPEHGKYIVGRKELFTKLEKIGCSFSSDTPRHNDPNTYIPGVNFEYKGKTKVLIGLHSIFGCGLKGACETCYDFLCMFVKPFNKKNGLYLKPCSVLDTRIDLSLAIQKNDFDSIFKLFKLSREYLMLAPGLNCSGWGKENEFKYN